MVTNACRNLIDEDEDVQYMEFDAPKNIIDLKGD
jgi:hypothetical protein